MVRLLIDQSASVSEKRRRHEVTKYHNGPENVLDPVVDHSNADQIWLQTWFQNVQNVAHTDRL